MGGNTMVKKAGTVILLLTVLILTAGLLTACGPKKYKITITSGEDLIDECPKRAAEGETVKIIHMRRDRRGPVCQCGRSVRRVHGLLYL